MELLKWRQEGAGTCLSSIGSHICQRARQEEEHRINDSRECGLRHHQVNQDQGWRRQEFKKVHLPAEISTPFYSHGSDMSIEVVVKLSPSGSVYCRRRHCTCAKRPRVSGVRLGKPGPVTRSRSIGGFFSCGWRAQSGRRLASQDLCASRKMLRFFATCPGPAGGRGRAVRLRADAPDARADRNAWPREECIARARADPERCPRRARSGLG